MQLDFLVPGFGKCGTTTLCALLDDHPEIVIPERKETAFFAFNFWRGWSWYEGLFADAQPGQLRGEGSTFYSAEMFEKESCERILEHYPEIRLIFIARDPIARIESYYRELHHSGSIVNVDAPFTLRATLEAFDHLIEDTLYWKRINVYRQAFPDSQIHVLFSEDVRRQPAVELARCFTFLGLDPTAAIANVDRSLNSGKSKLYDSPMMRRIRNGRATQKLWKRLSIESQNRVGRCLGLRKPFEGPIHWDSKLLDRVLSRLRPDAMAFLTHYGKSADFWNLTSPRVSLQSARPLAAA